MGKKHRRKTNREQFDDGDTLYGNLPMNETRYEHYGKDNPGVEDRVAQADRQMDSKMNIGESKRAYDARHRGNNAINTLQFTLSSKPKQGEFTYGDKSVITYNNTYYNKNLKQTPRMSKEKEKVNRPELPEPEDVNLNLKNLRLTLSYYTSESPAPQTLPKPAQVKTVSRDLPQYDYVYTGRNTINRVIYTYRASDRESSVSKLKPIKG